jgi:hypothetical protein
MENAVAVIAGRHYGLLKKFTLLLEDLNNGNERVAETFPPHGAQRQQAPGGCSQARKTTAAFVCVYKENR